MKKLLVDLNVILDVLFERQPHALEATALWAAIENRQAQGFVSAHSVTTLHYLAHKNRGNSGAKRIVAAVLKVFHVASVHRAVLMDALAYASPDFEDAVSAAAGAAAGCECVVTRDPKGFRGTPLPVLTPAGALHLIATAG